MFKERLKITGKTIVSVMLQCALFIGGVVVFGTIVAIASQFAIVNAIINTILSIILGVFGLLFAVVVIVAICGFIHWLFVEPYKERKKKRRDENDNL